MAPGAALSTHVGGVRYGHTSHAGHYPRAHAHGHAHGYGHAHGPSWGWGSNYPYVRYSEPITVINIWGFGGGYCEPQPWIEPPPAFWPAEPLGYLPTYVGPAPTYVVPAPIYLEPAPTFVQPPAYPNVPQDAAPVWPEPNLVPSPEPGPLPQQPQDAAPVESQEPALTAEEQQALGQSLEAFRREAYEEALGLLEPLAAKKPELGHAWLGIAHAAFAAGHTQRSAQALTKAALLGGFPRGYRFDPATLYASPETFRARRDALAQRLALRPDDADARLVSAWLLVSLGERAAAREQIDALLGLRPADEAAPILALALLPPVQQPLVRQPAAPQTPPAPGAAR